MSIGPITPTPPAVPNRVQAQPLESRAAEFPGREAMSEAMLAFKKLADEVNGTSSGASSSGTNGTEGLSTLYDAQGRGMRLATADDGISFEERSRMMDEIMASRMALRDHHFKRDAALRENFDLPSLESEQGGGLMLSGDITKVVDRWMANNGSPAPERTAPEAGAPAESTEPKASNGFDGTSMITLFIPTANTQNAGNEKVEILFDNAFLKSLASRSAEEVKTGLVDMLAGGRKANAMKTAMENGTFGAWFDANADRHPEFRDTNARFGYVDPDNPTDHPSLMIQSNQRPEYVRENLDAIVDSVMTILHGAYPGAGDQSPPSDPDSDHHHHHHHHGGG